MHVTMRKSPKNVFTFYVSTFQNIYILSFTWQKELNQEYFFFFFTSTSIHIYYLRTECEYFNHVYLFIDELEAACVSRRVEPSVEHDPEGVQLHGRAEASCHSCGAGHGWTGIDLQEPRSQVSAQHEIGSVEFKASLAGLHQVLCRLQGVDHRLLHAWDHDGLPFWPVTLLLQKSPELRARPHVVQRHPWVATTGRLKVLLDGVIAQVDWAEDDNDKRMNRMWGGDILTALLHLTVRGKVGSSANSMSLTSPEFWLSRAEWRIAGSTLCRTRQSKGSSQWRGTTDGHRIWCHGPKEDVPGISAPPIYFPLPALGHYPPQTRSPPGDPYTWCLVGLETRIRHFEKKKKGIRTENHSVRSLEILQSLSKNTRMLALTLLYFDDLHQCNAINSLCENITFLCFSI